MTNGKFTLEDIMGGGGHTKRPDHPDFWLLSEIILQLKAQMAENAADLEAQERVWRRAYEEIGDFDSIAYHAIQAVIQAAGYETGTEVQRALADPRERTAYVRSIQAYFDGFKMGAEFMRRKAEQA